MNLGRYRHLGELRYREIHANAEITAIQEEEFRTEKGPRKYVLRKRIQKLLQENIKAKLVNMAEAKAAEDEVERQNFIREAQKAEKNIQAIKKSRARAGIKGSNSEQHNHPSTSLSNSTTSEETDDSVSELSEAYDFPERASGSVTSEKAGGSRNSFTRTVGTYEVDDEPLLFQMSEIGRDNPRRSLEDARGGGSTGTSDRGGFERGGDSGSSSRRGSRRGW